MRAAEAIFLEHGIGPTGEITVGKKQKLGAGHELVPGGAILRTTGGVVLGRNPCIGPSPAAGRYAVRRYVSHVDLFGPD